MSHMSQNRENNKTGEETRHGVAYGYYQCVAATETSQCRTHPSSSRFEFLICFYLNVSPIYFDTPEYNLGFGTK